MEIKIADKIKVGYRQLVTIARAMAQQSKFILMDEPTSQLDYGNLIRTIEIIKNCPAKATASS